MEIIITKKPISLDVLKEIANKQFGNLVKAVVDIQQEIIAIGGELHADEEVALTEQTGSKREYTWGINLYPEKIDEEFIEFDSMINLKPAFGNKTRGVDDETIRQKIVAIVKRLVI